MRGPPGAFQVSPGAFEVPPGAFEVPPRPREVPADPQQAELGRRERSGRSAELSLTPDKIAPSRRDPSDEYTAFQTFNV